jgi:hypothetical protein
VIEISTLKRFNGRVHVGPNYRLLRVRRKMITINAFPESGRVFWSQIRSRNALADQHRECYTVGLLAEGRRQKSCSCLG